MSITKRIWGLWPDLNEMADDLTESVNALRRAKDAGDLPDPRHDRAIGRRARMSGLRFSIADIAAERVRKNLRPVGLDERRALIADFYEKAGGVSAVSERTGVDASHLYSNKSRGWLNKTAKFEFRQLAAEVGFDLPDMIFTRPKLG